jgi:tetratricopeptide (TPR) repeat protein
MDNSTPGMNELLVQYLDGTLQSPEKENVKAQLAADAALQQEFDSLLLTREAVRYYGLKEKVAAIHLQMMEEKKAPVKQIGGPRRMLRYAASIAASLLLLVGGYLAYTFFTLSSEKVYSANYQKYEPAIVRDGGVTESAIEKAYRQGNYNEVMQLHDANPSRTAKDEFICGVAALELSNNSIAIKCFTEVLTINNKTGGKALNDEAEYYLSLSYVRNRDYDYALDIMHKIKEDAGHVYNKKVTAKLLRQVKLLKWR